MAMDTDRPPVSVPNDDDVLAALADAVAHLEENRERTELAISKAEALARLRREGLSWEEVLQEDESPRLTTVLAEGTQAMIQANSRVRRALAATLHAGGLSMERIGQLLAISRQRVSAVLKETGGPSTDPPEPSP